MAERLKVVLVAAVMLAGLWVCGCGSTDDNGSAPPVRATGYGTTGYGGAATGYGTTGTGYGTTGY